LKLEAADGVPHEVLVEAVHARGVPARRTPDTTPPGRPAEGHRRLGGGRRHTLGGRPDEPSPRPGRSAMFCVSCGGDVPAGSRFCPRCGRATTPEGSAPPTDSPASAPPTGPPSDPFPAPPPPPPPPPPTYSSPP